MSTIFKSRITYWIFVLLDTINYGLEMAIAVKLMGGKGKDGPRGKCPEDGGGGDANAITDFGGYGGGGGYNRDRRQYGYGGGGSYGGGSYGGGGGASFGGGDETSEAEEALKGMWGPLGEPVLGKTAGTGVLMLFVCTLVFVMQTIMLRIGVHKLKTDPDAFDDKRQEEYEESGDENKFDRRTSTTGIYAMRFATAVFFTQTSTLYAIQRTLETHVQCMFFDIEYDLEDLENPELHIGFMLKAKVIFSIMICTCACFFWGFELYLMAKTLWGENGEKIADMMSGNQKKRVVAEITGKEEEQTDHPKLMSVATLFLTFCTIAGYCVYEGIMFAGLLMKKAHIARFLASSSQLEDTEYMQIDDGYMAEIFGGSEDFHEIYYKPIKWWVLLPALFIGLVNLTDSADLALLGFGYRPWFADLQKKVSTHARTTKKKRSTASWSRKENQELTNGGAVTIHVFVDTT